MSQTMERDLDQFKQRDYAAEDRAREYVKTPAGKAALNKELRQVWPHGHPSFLPITLRELQLHSDKNHDYAAGGTALGNFDRVAAILSNYPDLRLSDRRIVALVYALKQLDAVLWGINSGIVHKVEGLNERLQDISVYAKIVMCMNEEEANRLGSTQGAAPAPLNVPVGPRDAGLRAVVSYEADEAKEDIRGSRRGDDGSVIERDPRRI